MFQVPVKLSCVCVYYWSDNVVTLKEFTTYNDKCLPLAHFTASTATDCHWKKCIGQSEPCQVNYGSSKSTTQTVLALSFKSNSKTGTTWKPLPRSVKSGGTWLLDSLRMWVYSTFPWPIPGSRRELHRQSCSASNSALTTFQRSSVPVCLMRVLWRLLGGSWVTHAALWLWCAWSRVGIGSMWIGTLQKKNEREMRVRCF